MALANRALAPGMPTLPARGVSTGAFLPSFSAYNSRSCSLVGGLSRLRQRQAKTREVTLRGVRGAARPNAGGPAGDDVA
jgi:hypothetical protein